MTVASTRSVTLHTVPYWVELSGLEQMSLTVWHPVDPGWWVTSSGSHAPSVSCQQLENHGARSFLEILRARVHAHTHTLPHTYPLGLDQPGERLIPPAPVTPPQSGPVTGDLGTAF